MLSTRSRFPTRNAWSLPNYLPPQHELLRIEQRPRNILQRRPLVLCVAEQLGRSSKFTRCWRSAQPGPVEFLDNGRVGPAGGEQRGKAIRRVHQEFIDGRAADK